MLLCIMLTATEGKLVTHDHGVPVLRYAYQLKTTVHLTEDEVTFMAHMNMYESIFMSNALVYSLFQEEKEKFKKIEDRSLQSTVVAIYKHHRYSMSMRELDEYTLIGDGIFSIGLVTAAIGKVMCLAEPRDADAGTEMYVRWFLQDFSKEEKTGIPDAAILTGIRNSLGHANACYESEVIRDTQGDANFILYQRHQTVWRFTEKYRCTSREFNDVCARMRQLFLSWKNIKDYIPEDKDDEEAKEEMSR